MAGRKYYDLIAQPDGTVDVYLMPAACVWDADLGGVRLYGCGLRVVRGVVPWDGLEGDVRARFDVWCEAAEMVTDPCAAND